MKNPAAVALGKLGGSKKSPAKTKAARENAKKPRKKRDPQEREDAQTEAMLRRRKQTVEGIKASELFD